MNCFAKRNVSIEKTQPTYAYFGHYIETLTHIRTQILHCSSWSSVFETVVKQSPRSVRLGVNPQQEIHSLLRKLEALYQRSGDVPLNCKTNSRHIK